MLEWLTPAVGQLVLFFGMLFFLLLSRDRQRRFLVLKFESQDNRLRVLRILNEIEESFTRYVKVVSVVNVGVGLAAGLIAFVVGLPNPIVGRGGGAAQLHSVCRAGDRRASAVRARRRLAADAAGSVSGAGDVRGVRDRRGPSDHAEHHRAPLTLSPLATFVSLAFWTWLWGPLGTFLATLFLIAAYVVYNHTVAPDEPDLPG